MFDKNKEGFELNLTESNEGTTVDSDKLLSISAVSDLAMKEDDLVNVVSGQRSEGPGREIDEENDRDTSTLAGVVDQMISDPDKDHHQEPQSPIFRMVLFEQGLKALLVWHLAIGIVSSVVFIGRQLVVHSDNANMTWRWVGLIRCFMSLATSFMILWSKILLNTNPGFLDRETPENAGFFYSVVIISAALSWIHFLFSEFRNVQFWHPCAVLADVLFPIFQMIFIMVSVMLISDLIFHKIKVPIQKYFYVVYKSATFLLFFNCLSCLIFDVVDIESAYLQNYLSATYYNNSLEIFCYRSNKTSGFPEFERKIRNIIQVFPVILFVSSIAILLKPIRQFVNVLEKKEDYMAESSVTLDGITKSTSDHFIPLASTSILCGLIAFIIAVIGIPLDLIGIHGHYTGDIKAITQILSNVFPLLLLVVVGCLAMRLMKTLYDNVPDQHRDRISKVDCFIIWVCLCGHLVSCFKYFINSSQLPIQDEPALNSAVHILSCCLYCTDLLQSIIQAVVMDTINTSHQSHPIRERVFTKITFPVILLVSTNLGLLCSNVYILSNLSSYKTKNDHFMIIIWNIFSCISDPLSLIFRGYSVVFLTRFLTNLKCGTTPCGQI